MSTEPDNGAVVEEELGSLQSRMRKRATELENQVTQRFPIPSWDEILEVELSLVGWEALRKVVARHQRNRSEALAELYTGADQLLMGTEAFYEVGEKGGLRRITDASWITLAKYAGKRLPEDVTPRQAMIALMGDTNVLVLWKDWQDWMNTRRGDVEEALEADFQTTP